jgi:hypothetical protein
MAGLLLAGTAQAQTPAPAGGKAELQWFAQSAFKLTTPGGKVIMIDPVAHRESQNAARVQGSRQARQDRLDPGQSRPWRSLRRFGRARQEEQRAGAGNGTPEEFKAALGNAPVEVIVMQPGEKMTF